MDFETTLKMHMNYAIRLHLDWWSNIRYVQPSVGRFLSGRRWPARRLIRCCNPYTQLFGFQSASSQRVSRVQTYSGPQLWNWRGVMTLASTAATGSSCSWSSHVIVGMASRHLHQLDCHFPPLLNSRYQVVHRDPPYRQFYGDSTTWLPAKSKSRRPRESL